MSVTAPHHVLVADGDPLLLQKLFDALKSAGIASDCAADGGVAAGCLRARRYAVVVADVALAGTGDELLGMIAAMPLGERPVVLVLSAQPEATRSLDTDSVQIVLRKPVRLHQLVDLVRNCVRSVALRPHSLMAPRDEPDQPTS